MQNSCVANLQSNMKNAARAAAAQQKSNYPQTPQLYPQISYGLKNGMTKYIGDIHNIILQKMETSELNLESKDALKSILQEYEIHMKVIEQQLEMCKKDHGELRAEITRLVKENGDLILQLKANTEKRLQGGGGGALGLDDQSDLLDNLKQQLDLSLEEKQTLEQLWKSALNEVNDLRETLEDYRSGKQLTKVQSKLNNAESEYTEAIKLLDSKLAKLKKENDQLLVKTEMMEKQLAQASSQLSVVTNQNLSLTSSLNEATNNKHDWKSRFLALEASFIEMEKSYQADKIKFANVYQSEKVEETLKCRLEEALRQRDELQAALERCHERMAEQLRNIAGDRDRIEEAVSLVEGAMQDRDQALASQAKSAEDVKNMRCELERLAKETSLRVAEETSAIKKQYESVLTALRDQLQVTEQDRTRRSLEVQQLQRECDKLLALQQKNIVPQDTVTSSFNKQLNRVNHELDFAENECLELQDENQALRVAIEKLQDRETRNSREKSKLKNQLKNAERQNKSYYNELTAMTQKAELLYSQLQQTTLELSVLQNEAILLERERGLPQAEARVSISNSIELYKQLDASYGQMNDRWKKEMKTLTKEFEAKLKKVKLKNKKHQSKEDTTSKSNGTDSNHN